MISIINGAAVCGYRHTSFDGKDGSKVHGYNVYFQYPLSVENAVGHGVGYCYVSERAFRSMGLDIDAPIQVARTGQKFELVS